jgi:hypothetical protein
MKTVGNIAAATAIVALSAGLPSRAHAGVSDYVNFSGFGTVGIVKTNTDDAQFGRDRQLGGADKSIDHMVDTNLGFQLSAHANSWLSATVQGLVVKRDDASPKLEAEWAFLKVGPIADLTLRAGRMALPTFVVSDSRNVGFANTWLRAPNEVYGLAMLRRMDGVDLTYSHGFGPVRLSATVLAGDSELRALGEDYAANKVRGGNVQAQIGPVALRAGKVVSDVYVSSAQPKEQYAFTGYGITYDEGNVIAQAEYVQRRAEYYYNLVAANGWYTMAGYRFGSLTPYAIYSKTKPLNSPDHLPIQMLYPLISYQQKTVALGLRWDAAAFASVKFQVERADTNGTPGVSFSRTDAPAPALRFAAPVSKPVNVISLAVDFVF